MEPQRRELLAQCQQSLAQAMTEVEAVLGLLEAAGALSPGERRQLDEEAGGAKAELLLKLLLAKERDHFQDLRAALEKTQPHLLPILYLNGVVGPPQPSEGAGEWQTPPARPLGPLSTVSLCSSESGELARATHPPGAGHGWSLPSLGGSGEGALRGPLLRTSSLSPACRCEQCLALRALTLRVPRHRGAPETSRSSRAGRPRRDVRQSLF